MVTKYIAENSSLHVMTLQLPKYGDIINDKKQYYIIATPRIYPAIY